MKLTGFFLLLAGGGLVLSAVALLASSLARTSFVLAGVGVEVLGLVLIVRAHLPEYGDRG
jgi:putative exporter of polyketide antibiotics